MACHARLTNGVEGAATSSTVETQSTRFWQQEASRNGKRDSAFEASTRASLGGHSSQTASVRLACGRSGSATKRRSDERGCWSGTESEECVE